MKNSQTNARNFPTQAQHLKQSKKVLDYMKKNIIILMYKKKIPDTCPKVLGKGVGVLFVQKYLGLKKSAIRKKMPLSLSGEPLNLLTIE